jgi:hypothetical protein
MGPKRLPDVSGDGGRAWRMRYSEETRERCPQNMAGWVLYAEDQHPELRYWLFTLVDLDKIPGGPAMRQFTGARHQLMMLASTDPLDPDGSDDGYTVIAPPNFLHHVQGLSDGQVDKLGAAVIAAVVRDGARIGPKNREWWNKRLLAFANEIVIGFQPRAQA